MQSVSVIVLLPFITQTHGKELMTNHTSAAQDSSAKLGDKLSIKLVKRAFNLWSVHDVDLEKATLAKLVNLPMSSPSLPCKASHSRLNPLQPKLWAISQPLRPLQFKAGADAKSSPFGRARFHKLIKSELDELREDKKKFKRIWKQLQPKEAGRRRRRTMEQNVEQSSVEALSPAMEVLDYDTSDPQRFNGLVGQVEGEGKGNDKVEGNGQGQGSGTGDAFRKLQDQDSEENEEPARF